MSTFAGNSPTLMLALMENLGFNNTLIGTISLSHNQISVVFLGTFLPCLLSNKPAAKYKQGGKVMVQKTFLAILIIVLAFPFLAFAHVSREGAVDVRIVSDHGSEFAKFRTYPRFRQEGRYFYVEASKGERYSIQVTNMSNRRVGVVISVDGRNIIDGKKSELKRSERMYIIGPYETNTFEGWRTAMDRTNRFYFTEQSDSYAEKVFSDASAMGTIAVAVFREIIHETIPFWDRPSAMKEAPAAGITTPAPRASGESLSADSAERKKSEQAGTGFGETTFSPTRYVQFEPESSAVDRVVMKYEWRSELCKKGIIRCGPKNRLWPEGHEFAPIPRDFRG
ncbi:MAG: hypothetical protein H6Q53_861 [Deltaproteobacteria bacterium]|nr:hypothetical protein [Deltaproteobacteria bacterium]